MLYKKMVFFKFSARIMFGYLETQRASKPNKHYGLSEYAIVAGGK